MPVHDLKDQLARLPEQPGVYLWINGVGETIYVGKARSLRDRVRSYLGAYGLSPRHDALLDEIARVEIIVTDSVMEVLALETSARLPASQSGSIPGPASRVSRRASYDGSAGRT